LTDKHYQQEWPTIITFRNVTELFFFVISVCSVYFLLSFGSLSHDNSILVF
jgi:hypothetical protein